MTTLSEAVRALLPEQMPKDNLKIRATSDGYQATWGKPIAVRVSISHADFRDLLGNSDRALHSELATRLVRNVFDHVMGTKPVEIHEPPEVFEQESAPEGYFDDDPAPLAPGYSVIANGVPVTGTPVAGQPNITSFPVPEQTLTDAEVEVMNNARHPETLHPVLASKAADLLSQARFEIDSLRVKLARAQSWSAQHVSTFPEFPSHMRGHQLCEHELDTLASWARRQDPKSGRGAMIETLLAANKETERIIELRFAALEVCTDVAGEIEDLINDAEKLKLGINTVTKLKSMFKQLVALQEGK